MGKIRDLFRKTGDIKGTFHARMGMIKDRNGKDLTEAEDIKKRWQEHTEELYKKGLNDPDNHKRVPFIWSRTSWSVKSSGPWEAPLRTEPAEMEFQLSYLRS